MTDMAYPKSLDEAARTQAFVFNGTGCDVTAVRRSQIALVTFDNLASINERPVDAPWSPWLAARAERLNYSIIGMQSHNKDWYRTPEPATQLRGLVDAGYFENFDRILFIGASMGGFAALCLAGIVPGARVCAFSPQSTLNRSIAPFEKRYPWPLRKFDWDSPDRLDAADHVGQISGGHIFYDPYISEDKMHAARLYTPAIEQVRIPFADHTLVRTIVKCGAFELLLRQLAENGAIGSAFWAQMRQRRQDRAWAKQMVIRMRERGDGPLTSRACKILAETYGHKYARRNLKSLRGS